MVIVDLGAAPGGWSQYAAKALNGKGLVLALDILPMDALTGVTFIEGDFREEAPLKALKEALAGRPVDLVMSDMAPNMSGIDAVDQPRQLYLAELALEFSREVLRPGGVFLAKVFQGAGFDGLLRAVRREFEKVRMKKPLASRARSAEMYLLATGRRIL
jgi:23S rRNA (uridine2552-2'-O)-methyltransferase